MTFREHLPLSKDWLNKLERDGAQDVFQGKLKTYSAATIHPFWARSLDAVLPQPILDKVANIIPAVKTGRVGGKPNSPKLERHRYFTAAWSSHPCHCKYRYDGFWNGDIGCIGNPNGGPPIRSTVIEALSWFRLGII